MLTEHDEYRLERMNTRVANAEFAYWVNLHRAVAALSSTGGGTAPTM